MKINNVWSLHFENFLIEVEGSPEEIEGFKKELEKKWPDKKFMIVNRDVRGEK